MRKSVFVMMIAVAIGIVSCKKDNTSTNTAVSSETAAKVTAYIESNYPDAAIDYMVSYNDGAEIEAVLNTTESVVFDSEGNFAYEDHGGNGHGGHGGHHGDTLHPGGGGHPGGGHPGGGHHGTPIPVDSLPAEILAYISTNFSGYTAVHARIDSLCPEGSFTGVFIRDSGTGHMMLFFDAGNAFLMSGNRVLYSDVPAAVSDFISANYANYTIRHKSVKLTMASGAIQYLIFMKNGNLKKLVRVADDGSFVCEQ